MERRKQLGGAAKRRPLKVASSRHVAIVLAGCALALASFSIAMVVHFLSVSPPEESSSLSSRAVQHGRRDPRIPIHQTDASMRKMPPMAPPERPPRPGDGSHPPSRFAADFPRECQWVAEWTMPSEEESDCTILVRPKPKGTEGISNWVTSVAAGVIVSRQLECRLLIDYGPGFDVQKVLEPVSEGRNWTVPSGFQCTPHGGCYQMERSSIKNRNFDSFLKRIGEIRTRKGGSQPKFPSFYGSYRQFGCVKSIVNATQTREMEEAMPGFRYETGMACAFGSTLDLAPTASEFMPDLDTTLAKLRDPGAFVLALYVRTGWTDKMANVKTKGEDLGDEAWWSDRVSKSTEHQIKCALQLEEEHLRKGAYTSVIWIIMTDSTLAGKTLASSYQGQEVVSSAGGGRLQREVITTSSRGAHTRPNSQPNTADFAEAMLDWYLIGESDAVVVPMGPYSFGATAALRTARPIYGSEKDTCTLCYHPVNKTRRHAAPLALESRNRTTSAAQPCNSRKSMVLRRRCYEEREDQRKRQTERDDPSRAQNAAHALVHVK